MLTVLPASGALHAAMSGRGGYSYGSGSMGYNDLEGGHHMADEAEKDARRQAIARLAGIGELGNENKQTNDRNKHGERGQPCDDDPVRAWTTHSPLRTFQRAWPDTSHPHHARHPIPPQSAFWRSLASAHSPLAR